MKEKVILKEEKPLQKAKENLRILKMPFGHGEIR